MLDLDLLTEVLRGGAAVAREAGCPVAGGHTIDSPEPLYGMAVTGIGDPNRLLRKDAARAGLPLTPHQAARRRRAQLAAQGHRRGVPAGGGDDGGPQRRGVRAALAAGAQAATDVTGFGLLGHLATMLRSSGVGARLDVAAVPLLDGMVTNASMPAR